ncbi:hypothetical protein TNCV_3962341 [Trichonephila clavipes]|nr:hypothetical protein TNCV_3962341 [Trichonephila clavipes]
MKKTTFAVARPEASNCVVTSHSQPRPRYRSRWPSFLWPMNPQTTNRTIPCRILLFLAGMNCQCRYGATHSLDIFVRLCPERRILALQEWHQPYLMSD